MSFAGIDVLVPQRSRRDVKRNLKACANVTCSEMVHLSVMSHVHVRILRVAYERNPPVTGRFLSQRLVKWTFDVFFDLRLNKQSSKQSRRRWFETPSLSS